MPIRVEALARVLSDAQNALYEIRPIPWEERNDIDKKGLLRTARYLLTHLNISPKSTTGENDET